jgi:hypothetical protein
MLVFWIPVGILLSLVQAYLWLKWLIKRASPLAKKRVYIGFLIVLTIFFGVFLFRILQ